MCKYIQIVIILMHLNQYIEKNNALHLQKMHYTHYRS